MGFTKSDCYLVQLRDNDPYSVDCVHISEIKKAYAKGTIRIVYGQNIFTGKVQEDIVLDCQDFDTRGGCYQASEEVWTKKPYCWEQVMNLLRVSICNSERGLW